MRCDAAATLWNLALFVPKESIVKYRTTFFAACTPLVRLTTHSNSEVRVAAMGAVAGLAGLNDELRNEIARNSVAQLSLPQILSQASDRRCCIEAARAINNITNGDKGRVERAEILLTAGCVPPLVMLLKNEVDMICSGSVELEDDLVLVLLDALVNFAWGGDRPCNAIVEAGVCDGEIGVGNTKFGRCFNL